MTELVKQFAEAVKAEGGRAMLVGGFVRDEFLGLPSKDVDIEVYHLSAKKLQEVVSRFGKVDAVGASFQVYKLGQDIDVSLPRRERKTGVGHKGFTVGGDPSMSFKEACSRRDFTINAIMKDPLTGEIVDPFQGQVDIKAKRLRMVSPNSFQEDSLRVLRLVQFASRFGFAIDPPTAHTARGTDLSDLPKERVWMELEKMFLKSKDISFGVEMLIKLGVTTKLFPSFREPNSEALRKAPHFCNDLSDGEKLAVYVALFTWASDLDVLDELGLTSVDGYNVRKAVEELHLLPAQKLDSDYEYHKASQKMNMKLASKIFYAFGSPKADEFATTIERLGIVEKPLEPVLMGRHLIEMGFKPSSTFGQILDIAYDKYLRGELKTLEESKIFAQKFTELYPL